MPRIVNSPKNSWSKCSNPASFHYFWVNGSWVNIPEKYAIANIWVAWVSSAKGHLSRDRSGQLRCTAVQLEVVRRPVAELVGATATCTRAQFLAFQKLSSFRQQLRCCKNCFRPCWTAVQQTCSRQLTRGRNESEGREDTRKSQFAIRPCC